MFSPLAMEDFLYWPDFPLPPTKAQRRRRAESCPISTSWPAFPCFFSEGTGPIPMICDSLSGGCIDECHWLDSCVHRLLDITMTQPANGQIPGCWLLCYDSVFLKAVSVCRFFCCATSSLWSPSNKDHWSPFSSLGVEFLPNDFIFEFCPLWSLPRFAGWCCCELIQLLSSWLHPHWSAMFFAVILYVRYERVRTVHHPWSSYRRHSWKSQLSLPLICSRYGQQEWQNYSPLGCIADIQNSSWIDSGGPALRLSKSIRIPIYGHGFVLSFRDSASIWIVLQRS